jgi:hypothetical protein
MGIAAQSGIGTGIQGVGPASAGIGSLGMAEAANAALGTPADAMAAMMGTPTAVDSITAKAEALGLTAPEMPGPSQPASPNPSASFGNSVLGMSPSNVASGMQDPATNSIGSTIGNINAQAAAANMSSISQADIAQGFFGAVQGQSMAQAAQAAQAAQQAQANQVAQAAQQADIAVNTIAAPPASIPAAPLSPEEQSREDAISNAFGTFGTLNDVFGVVNSMARGMANAQAVNDAYGPFGGGEAGGLLSDSRSGRGGDGDNTDNPDPSDPNWMPDWWMDWRNNYGQYGLLGPVPVRNAQEPGGYVYG